MFYVLSTPLSFIVFGANLPMVSDAGGTKEIKRTVAASSAMPSLIRDPPIFSRVLLLQ